MKPRYSAQLTGCAARRKGSSHTLWRGVSLSNAKTEPRHRGADIVAIGADDIDRGTRQQPALGSRMTRTGGLIIGVEEVGEGRVEDPIARVEPSEDERLEEPGRMREMPLCRADIRHRLDRLILRRQIGGKRFTLGPYVCEPLKRDVTIAFRS